MTKLDTMSRGKKDKAIMRADVPKDAFRRMPPTRFRELSPDEIELAVTELKK